MNIEISLLVSLLLGLCFVVHHIFSGRKPSLINILLFLPAWILFYVVIWYDEGKSSKIIKDFIKKILWRKP